MFHCQRFAERGDRVSITAGGAPSEAFTPHNAVFTFETKMNRSHKKLDVWKEAVNLATCLYKCTETFPKHEVYGLTSQIHRAGVSVPSNIAEGAARNSDKDYLRFLNMANGSLSEIDTQLEIAKQLNYLSPDKMASIEGQIDSISIKLSGLIRHLKQKIENDK